MAEHLSEIRLCPSCLLAAVRVPAQDKDGKLAFQCANLHPVFWEDVPDQKKAADVALPKTAVAKDDALVEDAPHAKRVKKE